MRVAVTAILDVGKTNIKLCLLDGRGDTLWSRSRANTVLDAGPYPHFDSDGLWQWLLDALAEAGRDFRIEAINVSTHGACAVLAAADGTPVLPVLDYEFDGVEACSGEYDALRPGFDSTFSPALAAGLNLGRQLYWQRQQFPRQFAAARHLLLYPQYWVWRLSGVAVGEVTSLGCHTDLWCPRQSAYSPLVDALELRAKLPSMVRATDCAGVLAPALARRTGLPPDCRVYAGVHDSNASFARHLAAGLAPPFTVVSTGTWIVTMAAGAALATLDEGRDMLANVNVLGEPLACARFMGGREFAEICRRSGAGLDESPGEADVAAIIAAQAFALPAFASGSGPFADRPGALTAAVAHGAALGTLYLALMLDVELDLLRASGDVVFGSTSQKNPLLCRLLAQLRPGQRMLLSGDEASTVRGAWCLTRPGFPDIGDVCEYQVAAPSALAALAQYRDRWRSQLTDQ